MQVTRTEATSIVVEEGRGTNLRAKASLGVHGAASIEGAAQGELKNKYASTAERTVSRSDEISVDVPARTRRTVLVNWKRVWQHGTVTLRGQSADMICLPFKVLVDVTFDQTQVDEVAE